MCTSSPYIHVLQSWSLLNWHNLRLRCGCVAVPVNWFFDITSSFFAKFKNVVHSLEPGETPSYSASKLCATFLNIAKYLKTLRCGCVYFFNLLKTSTVVRWLFLELTRRIDMRQSSLIWMRRRLIPINALCHSEISFINTMKGIIKPTCIEWMWTIYYACEKLAYLSMTSLNLPTYLVNALTMCHRNDFKEDPTS